MARKKSKAKRGMKVRVIDLRQACKSKTALQTALQKACKSKVAIIVHNAPFKAPATEPAV